MLAFPDRNGTQYRNSDLPIYLGARFVSELAALVQSVAVGWTLYELSNAPLALGIAGAVQFIPMLLLTLPAGELCDRISPKRVLAAGLALQSVCAVAFLLLKITSSTQLWPFYLALLVFGAARACADPAGQALLPLLVPRAALPRAIALNASAWQVAVIAGPALGGLAYAASPSMPYVICGVGFLAGMLGMSALGGRLLPSVEAATLKERVARVLEGIAFIRSQPIVFGAMSLDLFAVLLGGATALLPIYARDILHVGPAGLGMLRSAPAVGACVAALIQVRRPPDRHLGLKLLGAVALFGITTVVFAVSTSLMLSLTALLIMGASDMVSVNIRSSLVQLASSDAMRGRVSSVNMLFIGASSELGEFESGAAAALLGTVPAVVLGGIGTIVVVAVWMRVFPALRDVDRLPSAAAHRHGCLD